MASTIDQQFIEYIVKSIVNKPEAVSIERRIDEKGVLLELTVDREDLGRVIGKRGATAQSLRTLLRALGTKNDARYNLKIVDVGPPPNRDGGFSSQSSDNQPVKADKPVDADAAAVADDSQPADSSAADEVDVTENEDLPESASDNTDHSSVIDQTRKELAELDDLDV